MYAAKKYRRLSDGVIIEAVQYRPPWEEKNSISKVASFILGIDTDQGIAVPNEKMLDVVRPLTHLWHMANGVATIEVISPKNGQPHRVASGMWIVKLGIDLIFFTQTSFPLLFEELIEDVPRSELDILANSIYDIFPWEGETYQAVAENVAASLIKDGWSRKDLS